MSVQTVSPHDLVRLRQQGRSFQLIDVRTPVEYAEVHVEGARLVPLDLLDPQSLAAEWSRGSGEPLYVICRSGSRAAQACQRLRAAGIHNLFSVEGGTLAAEQAGLRVVRGRKTISLERQVQVSAGLLVVIGVVLGWLVHPVFMALPVFVGAGLVFTGITGTCGMGLVLARMPWNRMSCGRSASGQ
jgi:rhodanese-related sulfurtransferase